MFYAAAQSFPDDLRKPTETIEQQLLLQLPALALLAEGFSVTLKCIGGGVAKVLAAPGDKIEEQDSRNLDCDDENVVYRVVNRAWTLEPANLPDFHVGISALTSYRELLRHLGLVFDLEVDIGPLTLPKIGQVRVEPEWAPNPVGSHTPRQVLCSPWTAFCAEALPVALGPGTFFEALGRGEDCARDEVRQGLLRDDRTGRYQLLQVDVDGAVLKLAGHESQQDVQPASLPTPASGPRLPALRQAGIALVDSKRGEVASDAIARCQEQEDCLACGREVVLHAEDLLQGYRIDVAVPYAYQPPAHWRSLCRRREEIWLGPLKGAAPPPDLELDGEGFVQLAANRLTDGTLKMSQSVFRWDG